MAAGHRPLASEGNHRGVSHASAAGMLTSREHEGDGEIDQTQAPRTAQPQLVVLVLLLAADLVLFALHSLHTFGLAEAGMFQLHLESSYAEFYQYLKFGWLMLLSLYAVRQRRSLGYLAWAATFCYLLLDDSLSIHEAIGSAFARSFGDPADEAASRFIHLGEIIASAGAIFVVVVLLVVAWWRGTARYRRESRGLHLGLLALGVAGVVIDAIFSLWRFPTMDRILGVYLEDGGEMVAASFMLFSMTGILTDAPRPDRLESVPGEGVAAD